MSITHNGLALGAVLRPGVGAATAKASQADQQSPGEWTKPTFA